MKVIESKEDDEKEPLRQNLKKIFGKDLKQRFLIIKDNIQDLNLSDEEKKLLIAFDEMIGLLQL